MLNNQIDQVQTADQTIYDIRAIALAPEVNLKTINNQTLVGSGNISTKGVYFGTASGTAAKTTSPFRSTKWNITISDIESLYDGLTITFKVPVIGDDNYGTVLQVNSLGYCPVVRDTNQMIGSRYEVGATILLVYVSSISGDWYNDSATPTTKVGCWVLINDQDLNEFEHGYDENSVVIGVDYVDSGVTYPATAGMKAFCWSVATNVNLQYTFTITDGFQPAHPTINVPSGALVSVKANYSWSFAGTLATAITPSSTQVIVNLFRTPPSNWIPNGTVDGRSVHNNPEDGYLWFPDYPEAGVIIKGNGAATFGEGSRANEEATAAFGRQNIADGRYSFVSGRQNKVAYSGTVGGAFNRAYGLYGDIQGNNNIAYGSGAHAEGYFNIAGLPGYTYAAEHAEGGYCADLFRNANETRTTWVSTRNYSEGSIVLYDGLYYVSTKSHSGVNPATDWSLYNGEPTGATWRLINVANGTNAHKEGTAGVFGANSHAGGNFTLVMAANGAMAHGHFNYIGANAEAAFVIGKYNKAMNGVASGTFGQFNINNGYNTIIFGSGNESSGANSIVGGTGTTNNGSYSIIVGKNLQGIADSQLVIGEYNYPSTAPFVVGQGVLSALNNIATIDASGNLHLHGKVYIEDSTAEGSGGSELIYMLPAATTSVLGGVKLGSDTVQSVAAQTVTSSSNRTYAIQVDSSGQMVVNVPWTDTDRVPYLWQNIQNQLEFVLDEGEFTALKLDDTRAEICYDNSVNNGCSSGIYASPSGPKLYFSEEVSGEPVSRYSNDLIAAVGDCLAYGECSTASATAAKATTIPGITRLVSGLTIRVKFSYANGNGAGNPTLNVNNLGAKYIKAYGTTPPGTGTVTSWDNGAVITLVYDGTYWMMVDRQSQLIVQQTDVTTNANYRVLLSNAANSNTQYSSTNKSEGLMFNPSTKQLTIAAGGNIKTNGFYAPTSNGGGTYGPGARGQVLTSNGTTIYWATPQSGGSTPITGTANPTTSTAGTIGQMYLNTTTEIMYVCTYATSGTYHWKPITFETAESQVG